MELEEVTFCNLCNGRKFQQYLMIDRWKLAECTNCGLVFLNPRPIWKEIKKIYDSTQYYSYLVGGKRYGDTKELRIRDYSRTVKYIEKIKKGGKILEIGSATGFFLEAARRRGWEVYGVEISETGVRYARKEFGINTFLGQLKEANFLEKYFDVIVIIHTLEHLPDPRSELERIRRILKDDGVLLIEVPNLFFHCKGFLYPPNHLFHFSPQVVDKMLKRANFTIIRGSAGESIAVFATKEKGIKEPSIPWTVQSSARQFFEEIKFFVKKSRLGKIFIYYPYRRYKELISSIGFTKRGKGIFLNK